MLGMSGNGWGTRGRIEAERGKLAHCRYLQCTLCVSKVYTVYIYSVHIQYTVHMYSTLSCILCISFISFILQTTTVYMLYITYIHYTAPNCILSSVHFNLRYCTTSNCAMFTTHCVKVFSKLSPFLNPHRPQIDVQCTS